MFTKPLCRNCSILLRMTSTNSLFWYTSWTIILKTGFKYFWTFKTMQHCSSVGNETATLFNTDTYMDATCYMYVSVWKCCSLISNTWKNVALILRSSNVERFIQYDLPCEHYCIVFVALLVDCLFLFVDFGFYNQMIHISQSLTGHSFYFLSFASVLRLIASKYK